jgi:hypothetical protein
MRQSDGSFPALVEALSRAEIYPHHPAQVEVRQSHISYVFLAGPCVYKIKKPVRFVFLDYSTIDKRRHFCKEEVRLNRRLAPDVYLGVVPILESEGSFMLGEGLATACSGRTVEYAVKMLRLPQERMLDSLIAEGGVGKTEMERLAAKLVRFHAEAGTEQAIVYGSPAAIWQKWSDSFGETEPFVGWLISAGQYRAIAEFSAAFHRGHEALFVERALRGRVCEGHGDLRAEHVCLTDGIVIFDCIEFNAGLRTCDVSSELAFLAMDLDFLGAPALADVLVREYQEGSRDEALPILLPYYKCYRAYVRGKVESLKSREAEVPAVERALAEVQAGRYFALAYRYARGAPKPALIIVCGVSGSGKSTLARMIRDRTGFSLVASDVTRKRLAGLRPTERAQAGYRAGIYDEASTDRTYRALYEEAENLLRRSAGAIVDATFQDAKRRRDFVDLAVQWNTPVLFVECRAPQEAILKRLERRTASANEPSDATRETYLRQRDDFMPIIEVPANSHLIVGTDGASPAEIFDRLEVALPSR